MKASSLVLPALFALFASPARAPAQAPPADTYFSLAVTENSHNHVGAARLFVDFQRAPYGAPDSRLGVIVSTESNGGIVLDGDASDWDPTRLTLVRGLVQNNYPLSEFIDGVPTDILVGSAWDASYVYFLVQWEDAGHDASTRIAKWIHGDQGGGESGWNEQVHVGATPGAPNAAAVNASGHVLAGAESEDRVFFMFPIVDSQRNFTPTGAGCAMYCHANLRTDFPWQNYTGEGVVAMHTSAPGDRADIWHWKSSRTEPSGVADDKYIDYALGSDDGRKSDAGTAAYAGNGLSNGNPTWMHVSGLGYRGDVLLSSQAVPFAGVPAPGTEIPRHVSRAPTGSRGDVHTGAHFDASTNRWTVELRRLRDTGNADDHSFGGTDAAPPTVPLITSADVFRGRMMYGMHCAGCHQPDGAGLPTDYDWVVPRVQRASGSLILKALLTVPEMNGLANRMTLQHVEDVAAYLQTRATFESVRAFGSGCANVRTRWVNSPTLGSNDFTVVVRGAAAGAPATLLLGFSASSWAGYDLPLDLTPFQAPGCWLLSSAEAPLPFTIDPLGMASYVASIGTSSALVGAVVYAQWVVLDPPANPLGATLSDALEITIRR